MEYGCEVFGHAIVAPVIAPGLAGMDEAVIALQEALLVPQEFPAVTQIFPDDGVLVKLTEMDVVPCPVAIVALAGTVHV